MTKISVIGGGAWGTALAAHLARSGNNPLLWMRDAATADEINTRNTNQRYLGDIQLPSNISATHNKADLRQTDIALLVIPAQSLRSGLADFADILSPATNLVLCAKGIEQATGKRTSEIALEVMPSNPISVLSGPSFAHDVAKGLPTAVTLAAPSVEQGGKLAEALSGPAFRPYASTDLVGVEWGGALKNVIALAIGMVRAKNLGASAEAALTTRGFAELSRIAGHFGANPETLMGLSCLGDLMLTCSSPQSRNFAYGMAVGRGDDLSNLKLAEGVHTTSIVAKICSDIRVQAPIIHAIDTVLSGKRDLNEAMQELLSRPLKQERD